MSSIYNNLSLNQKLASVFAFFAITIGFSAWCVLSITLKGLHTYEVLTEVQRPALVALRDLSAFQAESQLQIESPQRKRPALERKLLLAQIVEEGNAALKKAASLTAPLSPSLLYYWQPFQVAFQSWLDVLQQQSLLAGLDKSGGKQQLASSTAMQPLLVAYNKSRLLLASVLQAEIQSVANREHEAKKSKEAMLTALYVGGAINLLLAIIMSFLVCNMITRPLAQFLKSIQQAASGDLRHTLEMNRKDEFGQLAVALNEMCCYWRQFVKQLQQDSDVISESSAQLTGTSSQLSTSVNEVNTLSVVTKDESNTLNVSIAEVAQAIEEVSSNIAEAYQSSEAIQTKQSAVATASSDMASNMSDIAERTSNMATSVSTVASAIEEMSACISEIAGNTQHAAIIAQQAEKSANDTKDTINGLGKAADEIEQVVDVIKTIARQTNLLALNATIEAAKAGESGKGFAVVANEVKELARQSNSASEVIKARIQAIQESTQSSVETMSDISGTVLKIAELIHMISASVQQQTVAVNEISANVSGAAEAASEVTATVNDAAGKAREVAEHMEEGNERVRHIVRNLHGLSAGSNQIKSSAGFAVSSSNELQRSVKMLSGSSHNNSQSALQINGTAEKLSDLASHLNELLATFKV
jgi:methyl-accepting chemotaxis protein